MGAFFMGRGAAVPGVPTHRCNAPSARRPIVAGRLVRMPTTGSDLPEVVRIAQRPDPLRHHELRRGRRAAASARPPSTSARTSRRSASTPEYYEPIARRTNVMARVPGRDRDKPALVLHGHLDVVPADGRGLERRSVRRRGQRRDAVGSRRRRHEGHGRHDPHRRSPTSSARGSSPSAT